MRRIPIALALATTILLGLTAAPSFGRADPSVPTVGDRLNLLDGDQSFPALTPFHINHGNAYEPGNNTIGRDDFVLDMDGTPLTADFTRWIHLGDGLTVVKYWYYNFPSGSTGFHVFTRHYFAACNNISVDCDGNRINTPVEVFTASARVTFTP